MEFVLSEGTDDTRPPCLILQAFHAESQGPCQALPVNSLPIPFESDLFRGVIVVYIRHLATTPPHLFKGKKRLNWVAIQVTYDVLDMHGTSDQSECPCSTSTCP